MLERNFPNLYGWLVWGGGLHLIVQCIKVALYIGMAGLLVWLGYYLGQY